ncbi:Ldh family oxidoreductase [Patescibacteria group bacterium]|nr:Ldh family oxidoreductase [Patescibacteria group bacterium]
MKIKIKELESISKKALSKYGYNKEESEIILGMLMYAQLRGNNQGIVKLIGRGIPKHKDAKEPTIEKETPSTALFSCNLTMEAIVMNMAVKMVVKKAKKNGIAIVGTHNGTGSSGAIGYWSRQVADKGLIGITMSSYPFPSVPPHGSYEPLFCTNPIAWGVPKKGEPIVLDMASSAIAYYGLVEAKTKGVQVEEGIGYDKEGNETTDPAEIMEGATKPFDKGFKGAGLALMVQVIGGALVGADFLNGSDNDGNVIIAIDPDSLVGTKRFIEETTKMAKAMKKAKKLPGVDEIYVPGERGDKIRSEILKSGEIEVEDNLLEELKTFVNKK